MTKQSKIAPADLRDAGRKRVLMHATIITVDGAQRASVRNLTSSGALIGCERRLEEDWDVLFKRGDQSRAARVAWASKDEAGLQFYRATERSDADA